MDLLLLDSDLATLTLEPRPLDSATGRRALWLRRVRGVLGLALIPLALGLAWGLSGCDFDMAPPSELDALRILAVQAEPPEARGGETVALGALLHFEQDPSALAPTYEWRACFLESVEVISFALGEGGPMTPDTGLPGSCFDVDPVLAPDQLSALGLAAQGSSEEAAAARATLLASSWDLGDTAEAQLVVPPLPHFPAPPSSCGWLPEAEQREQGGRELWIAGLRLMLSLRVRQGDEEVIANKRLVLRPAAETLTEPSTSAPFGRPRLCAPEREPERCQRNENPELPSLTTPNGELEGLWDGHEALPLAPGQRIKLRPALPPEGAQQPFVAMDLCTRQAVDATLQAAGGEYPRAEGRGYAWYADAGSLDLPATVLGTDPIDADTVFEAPDQPWDGELSLYLVIVDGRGGTNWTRFPITLR